MTMQCPSCGCSQPDGLLCHDDTAAIETMLAAAPQLIDQLNLAAAKQTRLITGSKAGKGTAHLKEPINWGAVDARDQLLVELAVWGDDIAAIRKHPQAAEIVSGIGRAVKNAYRAIDRMADRQYLGRCGMYEEGHQDARCEAELWARPLAGDVRCPVCKHVHSVVRRRVDLLEMAKDMLFTVKDASLMIGEVGGIRVTEASIRGYLHRGRIGYRSGTMIRLGDLLAVVLDESERKSA